MACAAKSRELMDAQSKASEVIPEKNKRSSREDDAHDVCRTIQKKRPTRQMHPPPLVHPERITLEHPLGARTMPSGLASLHPLENTFGIHHLSV